MINILITFLVVAIVIGFVMLSMCDVIKDTDIRNEAIRQKMLKNKRMANAEPEQYRCGMCGRKFTDGGTFKRYNGKWYCLDCERIKAGEEWNVNTK